MRLVRQIRREHITHKQRLRFEPARIFDRIPHGGETQITQTDIPVLADFGLSDSCNNDFCHLFSEGNVHMYTYLPVYPKTFFKNFIFSTVW
jgi:hypothetical protein